MHRRLGQPLARSVPERPPSPPQQSAGALLAETGPLTMELCMRLRLLNTAREMEAKLHLEREARDAVWQAERHTPLELRRTSGGFALCRPPSPREAKTLAALCAAYAHVFEGLTPAARPVMGALMRHQQLGTGPAPTGFWLACSTLAAYAEDTVPVQPSSAATAGAAAAAEEEPPHYNYCFTPIRHPRQAESLRLTGLHPHPWWKFVAWYRSKDRDAPDPDTRDLYGYWQQIVRRDRFTVRFVYDMQRPGRAPKVPHAILITHADDRIEPFWIYGAPPPSSSAAGPPPPLPTADALAAELQRLKLAVEACEK